jgi:PHS family inorganic phosphate transporter-like MFS transporter
VRVRSSPRHETISWGQSSQNSEANSIDLSAPHNGSPRRHEREEVVNERDPFSTEEIRHFFWNEGNWRYLAGTSACAFLLHVTFAVLGNYDYRVLAQIWASKPRASNSTTLPSFSDGQSTSKISGAEIYNVLFDNTFRSLITVSVTAILGSLLAIKLAKYVLRRQILIWYSLILAVLVLVSGMVVSTVSSGNHSTYIVLYMITQLIFNLGKSISDR